MANICTMQAWSKREGSEAEWPGHWSKAAKTMDNTMMGDHLASTIFFQFGKNIRQIRQISQLN